MLERCGLRTELEPRRFVVDRRGGGAVLRDERGGRVRRPVLSGSIRVARSIRGSPTAAVVGTREPGDSRAARQR